MMKRRVLCFLLALLMVSQLTISAFAEETVEYPRDRVGKIKIFTTTTEKTTWVAALHEENESQYTILMTPQDIAELTGVTLEEEPGQLRFLRNGYEIDISLNGRNAEIFLNTTSHECYKLYRGVFDLEEIAYIADDFGSTDLYLPLEKMLYMLGASWYIENKTVFVFPIGDNMWDITAQWAEQYAIIPAYEDVVGETVGEVWGNAFKYGLLSVADELDARVFLTGKGFAVDQMEEALLELSAPVISRMESDEAAPLNKVLNFLNPPVGDMLERMGKWMEAAGNIPVEEVGTGVADVTERVFNSLTTWTPKKVGMDMGTFLDTANFLMGAWEAMQIVNRSQGWSEEYVAQLAYLSTLRDERFENKGWDKWMWPDVQSHIREAAGSLYSEYGNELLTGVLEGVKLGLETTVNLALQFSGQAAYFWKEAFDATVAITRTIIPAVDYALVDADKYQKTKCEYNVAVIAGRQYGDALEDLMGALPTQARLDEARMLGKLMTNAAGHCYYNLYILEGDSQYLSKAQVSSGYALRLDNSSQYDARLDINAKFNQLYSDTDGAVREQIPKEYVIFPTDQVIVTARYHGIKGSGYSMSYPQFTVYIPGNEEAAANITNSQEFSDMVEAVRENESWLRSCVTADQPGELYYYLEVESIFATGGALILRLREITYTGGNHPIHGSVTFAFDLVTGGKLMLENMLDPDNKNARQQLKSAIADRLEQDYGNILLTSGAAAAEYVFNGSASWELTNEGLTVSYAPASISSYGAGYITATVRWYDLNLIFANDYIPRETEARGTVTVLGENDPVVKGTKLHYGDHVSQAAVAQGRVNHLEILADGKLVAYANYLANALVWLPEAEGYTVTYNETETQEVPGPLA